MTAVLVRTDTTDVVEVHEPPAVLVDVLGTTDVSVVESVQYGLLVTVVDPTTSGVLEIVTAGPQGVQGDEGIQGEKGDTGPSPMHDQTFAVPGMVWVVVHPLNTKPMVTTVDQNGMEIIGDVEYPDNTTVIINFGLPFAGTARLKA